MTDRLVLGSGALSQHLVESLLDRPGTLSLITTDGNREDIYGDGVAVHVDDPTDRTVLADVDRADVVVVADDDPERNVAAARAARETFPDAYLFAYTGFDAGPRRATLETVADSVVNPEQTLTEYLASRTGNRGVKLRQLTRVLRSIDELAIVAHDNPDPDAIASAVALGRIAEQTGCGVDICYYGDITHQENRAFVNLLEFDLRNLDDDTDLEQYDGVALVDHSRPGVNDGLPEDTPVDIVIDHHPPRAPVEARFVDLRSGVGATSTLLVDYLEQFGMEIAEDVATGLLFGIRVDTREFTREVSAADFEAAASLLPAANLSLLERIESPSISADTFETIASAIRNRREEGPVLLSCVGTLTDRDALAQAADRLITMEGVSMTLVYGFREGTIFVSARAQGMEIDLGEVLRDAFGRIGSAGGHADMAGAQITMGVLESVEDRDESLREVVEAVIADRFLEALDGRTEQTIAPVYVPDKNVDEYLVAEEELPVDEDGEPPPAEQS
jgi:nanoRNase/pAp phosphatase (c-di-AMP/oligoRNAs hydrolase)